MNYQRHYDLLITRAQQRSKPNCYTERHHILPKCCGGGNEKENMVVLTAREHYIAHVLLVRIHPEHKGLLYAARFIARNHSITSCQYAYIRERAIKARIGYKHSDDVRAKIGRKDKSAEHIAAIKKAHIGKFVSEETRAKIGAKSKQRVTTQRGSINLSVGHSGEKNGRHGKRTMNNGIETRIVVLTEIDSMLAAGWCMGFTPEQRAAMGKAGKPISDAHRAAISRGGKGRVFSVEHRAKIGDARRRAWAQQLKGIIA